MPLFRIFLSLVFSLPVTALFLVFAYVYLTHYDTLFEMYLGQVLTIPLIMLLVYSLTLPFQNYKTIRDSDWQEALLTHVGRPFLRYFPLALMWMTFAWAWIWFCQYSIKTAVVNPPSEQFIFLFSCLLPLNEVFKARTRSTDLNDYVDAQEQAGSDYGPALRLSHRQLNVLLYAQSVAFLLIIWCAMILGFFVIEQATMSFLAVDWQHILFVTLMGVIFVGMRKLEKQLESRGRERRYIPWDSKA